MTHYDDTMPPFATPSNIVQMGRLFFLLLHDLQQGARFKGTCNPPLDNGYRWSNPLALPSQCVFFMIQYTNSSLW